MYAAMKSFSHYAFGSVAECLFIHALGTVSEGSVYRNIIIDPVVSREMDHMKGSYHSINGLITSAWSWKGDRFELEVSVPVNTRAEIHIPSTAFSSIRESRNLLSEVSEIKVLNSQNHDPTVLVGSGRYLFTSMLK